MSTSTSAEVMGSDPGPVLEEAERMVRSGNALAAIDHLHAANRSNRHPAIERRLVELRHAAFTELDRNAGFDHWPVDGTVAPGEEPPQIPELDRAELTAEVVRDRLMAHGSVRINGLFDPDQVARCISGIETALEARAAGPLAAVRSSDSWYHALPLPADEATSLGRHWVAGSGGVLTLDSPRMAFELLELYDEIGLRPVVAGYLGERPVLSGNKWTLRRVPTTANTDWHQDGAFLGSGIRALNLWVALSDCGVDSPGMDVLPRRLDRIVETGTGGAIFDWAVGPDTVEGLAARYDAPVIRPEFRAGDALLFDDLFLHRTAVEPAMTQARFALESWFFAPSVYPEGQVPIVW